MNQPVSKHADQVILQLVEWELLGADLDPRELLRSVETSDLLLMMDNVRSTPGADQFLTTKMVDEEIKFRQAGPTLRLIQGGAR